MNKLKLPEGKGTIFCTGFILGAMFAYSGTIGFLSGCALGVITTSYIATQLKNDKITDLTPVEPESYFVKVLTWLKLSK